MLVFVVWQSIPVVIGLLSAIGKVKHDWQIGGMQDHLLNTGCLLVMIHVQLVPLRAIGIAFFVWCFLPFLIGSTESIRGNTKNTWHKRRNRRARRAPLSNFQGGTENHLPTDSIGGTKNRLLNAAGCLLVVYFHLVSFVLAFVVW